MTSPLSPLNRAFIQDEDDFFLVISADDIWFSLTPFTNDPMFPLILSRARFHKFFYTNLRVALLIFLRGKPTLPDKSSSMKEKIENKR